MSVPPQGVQYDPWEGSIEGYQPSERWLSQLADSFTDQTAYHAMLANGDCLVYRVTNVAPAEGEGQEGQLLYALGVLMPGRVGDEYFLTRGHIHAWRPAAEVYICLNGKGMMLFENEQTGEFSAVEMSQNQVIYVPGFTAHRTVNTGDAPLVYWGVLSSDAGHDYEYVQAHPFHQVIVQAEGRPTVMLREQYQQSVQWNIK